MVIRKTKKKVKKINKVKKHLACMLCSEKMAIEDACYFVFFHFWERTKLVKFTLRKQKNSKFSQFLYQKIGKILPE